MEFSSRWPKNPGRIGGWSTYHIFHPESMNTVDIYTHFANPNIFEQEGAAQKYGV